MKLLCREISKFQIVVLQSACKNFIAISEFKISSNSGALKM